MSATESASDASNSRPVAFITGAAHGQGRAAAIALAEAGYDIVAFDIAKPLPYPGYGMGTSDDLTSSSTTRRSPVCAASRG